MRSKFAHLPYWQKPVEKLSGTKSPVCPTTEMPFKW